MKAQSKDQQKGLGWVAHLMMMAVPLAIALFMGHLAYDDWSVGKTSGHGSSGYVVVTREDNPEWFERIIYGKFFMVAVPGVFGLLGAGFLINDARLLIRRRTCRPSQRDA